jgi:hypothetical protein
MNNIIQGILNGSISVCDNEIIIEKYQISETPIVYLNCAIDFHCFPKMPDNVLSRINSDLISEFNLTSDEIRSYIWFYDSSINVRVNEIINVKNLNIELWNTIIKPKCDIYRSYILKSL